MKHFQENKGFHQSVFLTERFIFTGSSDTKEKNYISYKLCFFEHFTNNINKCF